MEMEFKLFLLILSVLFFALNMGGSNIAPAFAALYGAKIIKHKAAVLWFTLFVFLGGILLGFNVVKTLGNEMIPASMLLLPLFLMIMKLRLTNTYLGMIIAYSVTSLPFSIWILKGYYDTIPKSLEEAALVDGTTRFGAFLRIILPLSTPALAIAFLFNFTQAWNEYLVARVVLTDARMYTWTLGLFELQGQYLTQWGMFAAASILVPLPVLGVFLYSSKWLISGLTLGGVKG